jgi:hypothetical protein
MERGRHAADGVLEVERELGLQVGAALGSDAGRAAVARATAAEQVA